MPDTDLREIAQRNSGERIQISSDEITAICRAYLDLTAPLTVKCEKCGGEGSRVTERSIRLTRDDGRPMEKYACDECNGTGRTDHPAVAALWKAVEKICHDKYCHTNAGRAMPCSCGKAPLASALAPVLSLLSAAESRILAIEGENRGLESVIASQRRALDEAEARERKLLADLTKELKWWAEIATEADIYGGEIGRSRALAMRDMATEFWRIVHQEQAATAEVLKRGDEK